MVGFQATARRLVYVFVCLDDVETVQFHVVLPRTSLKSSGPALPERHTGAGFALRISMAPGVYFRCLLIGYFEGLDSERGIAWRTAGSLSLP